MDLEGLMPCESSVLYLVPLMTLERRRRLPFVVVVDQHDASLHRAVLSYPHTHKLMISASEATYHQQGTDCAEAYDRSRDKSNENRNNLDSPSDALKPNDS